jgi:penicillin amidase
MKNLNEYLPDLKSKITSNKIIDDLDIFRDKHGIPHVYAKNDYDAFFGQGFATAQDRLWHMEYDRKRAYGKLSEIIGTDGLENDKFMGALNISNNVQSDFNLLDDNSKNMYRAYSDGVNEYLKQNDALPIEFELINTVMEKWDPWDCLAVFKARHIMMGVFEGKIWRNSLIQKFDLSKLRNLFTGYEEGSLVIVPPEDLYVGKDVDPKEHFEKALEHIDYISEIDIGSNSWVVGGELSSTGKPLMAGDPHRGLDTPSVYYQNHIRSENFDVIGLSFPGCPGFPHFGHNEKVSWCVTHAGSDYQDLFIEKIRTKSGSLEYYNNQNWEKAEEKSYQINVLNDDPIIVNSYKTDNGYIIGFNDDESYAISFRYSSTEIPNTGFNVIRNMMDAKNSQEMEDSMDGWVDPCNNFLFADSDGDYGYINRGKIPLRNLLNAWVPVPGWEKDYKWEGFVPFDRLPRIFNPENGFIVTANNKIVNVDYPFHLSLDSAPEYRAKRITERLKEVIKKSKVSPEDMISIHSEITSIPATIIVKSLSLLPIDSRKNTELLSEFLEWDCKMERSSIFPTIYSEMRYLLNKKIISNLLDEESADKMLSAGGRGAPSHLRSLSSRIISHISKNKSDYLPSDYSEWNQLLYELFNSATENLSNKYGAKHQNWKWDKVHMTKPKHLLSSLFPDLGNELNPPSFSIDGDGDTPHNASPSNLNKFDVVATSVARYFFDVSDWDNCKWIVPLGSSGHPGSENYSDQGLLWKDDKVIDMQYSWNKIKEHYTKQMVTRSVI